MESVKTSKVFLRQMLGQGADLLGIKKVLKLLTVIHSDLQKYNTNHRDLIQELVDIVIFV